MLLSTSFRIRPRNPFSVPPNIGQMLHGMFLRMISQADSALSGLLHDTNSVKPFAISELVCVQKNDGKAISMDSRNDYVVRIATYSAELTICFDTIVRKGLFDQVDIGGHIFDILSINPDNGYLFGKERISYKLFIDCFVNGVNGLSRDVTVRFVSPTTFKIGNKNMPIPLPSLMFPGYVRKWNAYSPLTISDDILNLVESGVGVSRYELKSVSRSTRKSMFVGGLGKLRLTMLDDSELAVRMTNLLIAFSYFCGTGQKTTMGLGQTIPDNMVPFGRRKIS